MPEHEEFQTPGKGTEARLQRLLDNLPFVFMVYQLVHELDGTPRFLYVSGSVERLYGVTAEAVLRDASLLYGRILEEDRALVPAEEARATRDQCMFSVEVRTRTTAGDLRWIYLSSTPTRLADGRMLWDGIETDITERKQAEFQREELIGELQEALSKVNVLSGLLSICASCKKIRDENGQWEHLEVYIRDRSAADFSHSLCPACFHKLYGSPWRT